MEFQEISEIFDTVVSEISSDPIGLVPLSPEIVSRITDGDDDPRFATFVIESGWSKSKRFWGPELFGKVATEMNQAATSEPIVGYMGHIRPDDNPYSFPEIQLQWVGAKLLPAGNKARLAVKAYVLPGTLARGYFKRGLVKAVSWRGKVAQEMFEHGVRIKEFAIESIDLSRPRAAGMSARLVELSSEMEEEDSVKPEEIAALAENELRAHNPTLVATIESSARKPAEDKVGEMENEAASVKPTLDLIPNLRELLGLDANADSLTVLNAAVTSLREQGRKLRDTVLDGVLEKKFRGKDSSLLRRVLVGEMATKELKLTGKQEDDEKTVGEMVDQIVNSDESLKQVVSEMEGTPASVTGTTTNKGTANELKAGSETSNLRVRSVA